MQAFSQSRQPMHFSSFNKTPPPVRFSRAWLGHTSMHAGSLQPRHTMAIKLLAMPPVVRTLIALFIREWLLLFITEQTLMQEKQPRHFLISLGCNIFGINLPPDKCRN